MKTLFALLLSCLCAAADPIACQYYAKDGFLTVTWCNIDPAMDYWVEWSTDAIAWLVENRLSLTGTVELQMTEPRLFVRLVEYPRAVREQRENKGTN